MSLYGTKGRSVTTALLLLAGTAATAQDQAPPATGPVAVMQHLYDCRAIADNVARLACYDAQVAAVQTAEQAREVRIVDREQMREARRGLFGFSLSNLRLFGGGNDDDDNSQRTEEVTEIVANVASARWTRDGGLAFSLDNGQHWRQTDSRYSGTVSPGQSVRIRRAALGSFMASIEGRPAMRVRRER